MTPVIEFPVAAQSGAAVTHSEWLDFCPQEVSLHFRLADAPAMGVLGKFTHECIVPEPSSILAAAMGMLGLASVRPAASCLISAATRVYFDAINIEAIGGSNGGAANRLFDAPSAESSPRSVSRLYSVLLVVVDHLARTLEVASDVMPTVDAG